MSIPTPFNPLGTLGAGLPYVQPVMTGRDSWNSSIPCSFGCAFTAADHLYANSTEWSIFRAVSDSEKGWWTSNGLQGGSTCNVTFERELKISGVTIIDDGKDKNDVCWSLDIYARKDGEWVQILTWDRTTADPFKRQTDVAVENAFYAAEYKMEQGARGNTYSRLQRLKLDAVYKQ